jgi:hypothetical protein
MKRRLGFLLARALPHERAQTPEALDAEPAARLQRARKQHRLTVVKSMLALIAARPMARGKPAHLTFRDPTPSPRRHAPRWSRLLRCPAPHPQQTT